MINVNSNEGHSNPLNLTMILKGSYCNLFQTVWLHPREEARSAIGTIRCVGGRNLCLYITGTPDGAVARPKMNWGQ